MQTPSDVAARSVGEKELPSPWLSTGAAVRITIPEGPWVSSVFRLPMYLPVISTAMTILLFSRSLYRPQRPIRIRMPAISASNPSRTRM